ncbi:hypothetical protein [Microvirga roseola]|uniref:hypothetical protein n=1 Tax=Microvirga roseola TaxID=2883126 RepID=UPI001E3A36EF|nr:hypothetical protein [Microvirga roseola]
MDPPPSSARPTTAQLKGDIDSGRTGDKVEVFDPGLSPLGTDDEAGGHPPTAEQVATARHQEGVARWQTDNSREGYAHRQSNSKTALYSFIGFIALLLVLFVVFFWAV